MFAIKKDIYKDHTEW